MSSKPESYPHLDVQLNARNMLISALHMSQFDEKPGADARRAKLQSVVDAYQSTVDALTGTVSKQTVGKNAAVPPGVSVSTATIPSPPATPTIRFTRSSTGDARKLTPMRAARMPKDNAPESSTIRATAILEAKVGRAVLAWRKARGWSQAQAALQLDISKRTVQDWEQGRYRPNKITAAYIMDRISSSAH